MAPPVYFLFKKYSVEVKRWLVSIFHVPRLDEHPTFGSSTSQVKVVYASPERAIAKYVAQLRNKQTDIPIVSFYLANFAYQLEKNTAIENLETVYDQDNSISKRMKPFLTYSLTYVINIWTKLQMDMDIVLYQLVSQFTPFRYLAVDSSVDYNSYENRKRYYPIEDGPEQGKNQDENGDWIKKPGQWFPMLVESVADASNLEPGELGDRLIRTDVTIVCDRAYLPVGGYEYKPIYELEINSVLDYDTAEGISIFAITEADFEYLMTHDDDWLSPVATYSALPLVDNSVGDIRRVEDDTQYFEDGDPYVWGAPDTEFYRQAVATLNDLPLTGNIDGEIRYVNGESKYYRWNGYSQEWLFYNRWIKYRHYLREMVI